MHKDICVALFNWEVLNATADDGGMDPEGMRRYMSLGYSMKKGGTTIGQCNLVDNFHLLIFIVHFMSANLLSLLFI